jgi:hypothetical protein
MPQASRLGGKVEVRYLNSSFTERSRDLWSTFVAKLWTQLGLAARRIFQCVRGNTHLCFLFDPLGPRLYWTKVKV